MKLKKWKIITASLAALMLITAVTLTVYAYFSTQVYVYTNDGDKQKLELGMNLQLLFDKLDEDAEDPEGNLLLVGKPLNIPYYELRKEDGSLPSADDPTGTVYYNYYQDPESDSYVAPIFDPTAPWGSPQNPYIISNERHLQNLSTLQRVGYFDVSYIRDNYTVSGSGDTATYTYNGGISMPYFLVCNASTGGPVVIDGTNIGTVRPIGSAEHPFIGVIGGAFTSGSATVGTGTNAKTVSLSTFHNIKVQTDVKQVDVGLFGYVGYMGTPPADGATEDYIDENGNKVSDGNGGYIQVLIDDFEGVASVIQNLILSDVQVTVSNPTLVENISNFFKNLFGTNHRFSYTGTEASDADPQTVPHETNHIGIFAGHVSYASIEYISVYYSSGNVCAIDLLDAQNLNYHSTTGIVGFLHRMNAPISNVGTLTALTGDCRISITGTSSGEVILNPGGVGSGGGLEIGLGRGYVMAKTLYNGYHYIDANQALGDRVWKYTSGDTSGYAMMVYQNPGATTYVDQDGIAAIIASDNSTVTIGENVYKSFIVRRVTGSGTANDPYVYTYWLNNTTAIDQKNIYELSQPLWQYAASAPTDNNTPAWVDAVMLYETGVGTGTYTLPPSTTYGGTTVAGAAVTVAAKDGGGYKATINGTTIYAGDGNANKVVEIDSVIFYRMVTAANGNTPAVYTCSLTPTGTVSAPYIYREKPMLIRHAKTMYGTELCVETTEGLDLTSNQLGNFYFYDGVFTFALSSAEDTIEPTWENDTPDQIVLGANDASKWEQGPYENDYFSVVAFVQKVTDLSQIDPTSLAGKNIFIGYYTAGSDGTWNGGSLAVMSLETSDDPHDGFGDNQNDRFTTAASSQGFLTVDEFNELKEELQKDPTKNADILAKLNNANLDMQVLNLGSAVNLQDIMDKYRISVSKSGNDFVFSGSKNAYKLGLLRKDGWLSGNAYSIWCGSGTPSSSFGYSYGFDSTATIANGASAGTFSIKYETNGTSRYVAFNNSTTNPHFKGSGDSTDTYINLCFYIVESMTTVATGHVVYNPTENGATYSADEYILWPQAVLTQNGTMVNGTLDSSLPHDASDTKTDDTNATNNVYKSYNLVSLQSLISGDAGWQNGQGGLLGKTDLSKKFTMQNAIQFGASLKLPSGTNIQIDNNSVLAPVGPGGAYANIPTGSIAFRINKTGTSKIRVIVSVPVSQFYDGESTTDSLYNTYDYYLGLWKTEDVTDDGNWKINYFNQTSAVQKFELPRSRPYAPGTTAAGSDYILVQSGNTTYRCYLNGERVLVGYEFTVTEAGTYILGTAIGETSVIGGILGILGGSSQEPDEQYPMEIVYASADGTASPGNDGTSSSIYGSIDYVYSYNGKIIHVQDYTNSASAVDYNRYYNSGRLTFTQNELTTTTTVDGEQVTSFINIRDFRAFVWRTVETDNNGTPADTSDDVTKIYLNISVKSDQDAQRALMYYRSVGFDPDQIRITVGARTPSTS